MIAECAQRLFDGPICANAFSVYKSGGHNSLEQTFPHFHKKTMNSSFLLVLALLGCCSVVEGRYKATHRTYTNTGTLDQCLQRIESKVCDPHGVFTEEERERLNTLLARVEESTKREGYPMSTATKKCGMTGITVPIIMLKAEMINAQEVQRQLNDVNKEYTDAHPCKRIAIIMMHQSDKIERRSFWANNNWNVNVKPSEIVALYRKEIPRVTKAHYVDALHNIVQEFMSMATQRLQTPFEQAPMTRTYTTTAAKQRGQAKYTAAQNEQPTEQTEQQQETPSAAGEDDQKQEEQIKPTVERKHHKYAGKKTEAAETDKATEERRTKGGKTDEEEIGSGGIRKTEAAGSDDKAVEEEDEEVKRTKPTTTPHRKPVKKPSHRGGSTYAKAENTETAKDVETSD